MNFNNLLNKRNMTTPSKWLDFRAFGRPFFGQYGMELANTIIGFTPPLDYKVSADLKRLNSIDFDEPACRNRFALLGSYLMRDAGDTTAADFCSYLALLPQSLFKPFAQYFIFRLNTTIAERYINELDSIAPEFVIEYIKDNEENF